MPISESCRAMSTVNCGYMRIASHWPPTFPYMAIGAPGGIRTHTARCLRPRTLPKLVYRGQDGPLRQADPNTMYRLMSAQSGGPSQRAPAGHGVGAASWHRKAAISAAQLAPQLSGRAVGGIGAGRAVSPIR